MNLVVETSPDDQPPVVRASEDLRLVHFTRELLFRHPGDSLRALPSEPRELPSQGGPVPRAAIAGSNDRSGSRGPREILEDPDVGVDEVLDDVDKAQGVRSGPPLLVAGLDLADPLPRRFPDGLREEREALRGRGMCRAGEGTDARSLIEESGMADEMDRLSN